MPYGIISKCVKTSGLLLAVGAWTTLSGCSISLTPPQLPGFVAFGPPQAPAIPQPPQPPDAPADAEAPAAAEPTDDQLQQLVAPIALYPDPLLAEVLPAATFPEQVQAAEQFVNDNPSSSDDAIAAQDWDPSVKALVRYPTVLKTMSDDLDWTTSLGAAFTHQQADVFAAVQDMRAQAQAQGNLATNAQVAVVMDGPRIVIQPAIPTAIFVPVYDPVVVFQAPFVVTFGPPCVVGPWLGFGCDWTGGCVFVGDWQGPWAFDGGVWGFHDGWRGPGRWARDGRWGEGHRWGEHGFRSPHAFRGRGLAHVASRHAGGHGGYGSHAKAERDNHAQSQTAHAGHGGGSKERASSGQRAGPKAQSSHAPAKSGKKR